MGFLCCRYHYWNCRNCNWIHRLGGRRMTEEIQKRIEAIKAGKVPDGYKKAVVGIVPSEWQEKRLSDLLKFQNGVNAEKEKFNSGIKMISVMDILDERPIVYDAIRGQVDI